MNFLFNRITLKVFVSYLTGALYVHPLWFYKHQHDNRVRSKLFVACQRWWFQWRFAAILENCAPSGEMHNCCTPRIIKESFENFLIHRCNYILLSQVYCVWQVVKTPTIIFNNPVYAQRLEQVAASIFSGRVGLRIPRWKFKLQIWKHHFTATSNIIRSVTLRIVEE